MNEKIEEEDELLAIYPLENPIFKRINWNQFLNHQILRQNTLFKAKKVIPEIDDEDEWE
ncbi:MAG: hypothetical protein ACFFBD_09380 [Candidatus Hodarchaeota archaeon]